MARASRWFQWILRWGLGALLIFAAWGKLSSPFGFAVAVTGYGVVGQELALWIAVALPVLELFVGLMLISGLWLDAAVMASVGLYTAFLILVVQARVRGLNIDCGCFHVEGGGRIDFLKVVENTAYAVAAWVLAWLRRSREG